ncbi:MAG: hypothetical protein KGY80_06680 [Candidatus Thorarchaeota archaeon]|nr:hypothetical protein [Candidatus Thorarchaeota archaeon]
MGNYDSSEETHESNSSQMNIKNGSHSGRKERDSKRPLINLQNSHRKSQKKLYESSRWVIIRYPMFEEEIIRNSRDLDVIVRDIIPGIQLNKQFETIMEMAKSHLTALNHFNSSTSISASEIRDYSEKKSIPLNTLRKWILKGITPRFYIQAEQAISNKQQTPCVRN